MIPPELTTLRDVLRWTVSRFNEAQLCFGHGTQDAFDEAVWLSLHVLHLPHERLETFLDARLSAAEKEAIAGLVARRIGERVPTAYLTHEAWLGDYRFYVDERVIVPRSHIAGLLMEEALSPWLDAAAVADALDLCTGSGCLAVLLALTFSTARIDAADLSADALAVARRNVADYGLAGRIRLIQSDLFAALSGRRYDLIVCNPPYVTDEAMRALPAEYRHEPALALAGGADGLDVVRRLLAEAPPFLKPDGIMVVEVGDGRAAIERAFAGLELVWLDTDDDGNGVFLIERKRLG